MTCSETDDHASTRWTMVRIPRAGPHTLGSRPSMRSGGYLGSTRLDVRWTGLMIL